MKNATGPTNAEVTEMVKNLSGASFLIGKMKEAQGAKDFKVAKDLYDSVHKKYVKAIAFRDRYGRDGFSMVVDGCPWVQVSIPRRRVLEQDKDAHQ